MASSTSSASLAEVELAWAFAVAVLASTTFVTDTHAVPKDETVVVMDDVAVTDEPSAVATEDLEAEQVAYLRVTPEGMGQVMHKDARTDWATFAERENPAVERIVVVLDTPALEAGDLQALLAWSQQRDPPREIGWLNTPTPTPDETPQPEGDSP